MNFAVANDADEFYSERHTGPRYLAARMAKSCTDVSTIRCAINNRYGKGKAPPDETIEQMIRHNQLMDERRRRFVAEPKDEDGIDWVPRGTVKLVTNHHRRLLSKSARGKLLEPGEAPQRHRITLTPDDPTAPYRDPLGIRIIQMVARAFNLSVEDLKGRRRFGHLTNARKTAYKLLREQTFTDGTPRFSYPKIGDMIGGRDHSTVVYGIATFDAYASKYPEMQNAYDEITARLAAEIEVRADAD